MGRKDEYAAQCRFPGRIEHTRRFSDRMERIPFNRIPQCLPIPPKESSPADTGAGRTVHFIFNYGAAVACSPGAFG